MFDFIVVGAGGAGLGAAEALQRSGATVALVEQHRGVCSVASSCNHSWFHTGALYSMFPTDSFFKAMVANVDVILEHYSQFPNMNLRMRGGLASDGADGWFGNRVLLYGLVRPGAQEVPNWLRLPWLFACRRARSRLAFYNSCKPGLSLASQVHWLPRGPGAIERGGEFVAQLTSGGQGFWSSDRTMNTTAIMRDLLGSFLSNGGRLCLGSPALRVSSNEVIAGDTVLRARHVIVAAGHESSRLAGVPTRVVWSPLMVVWPALTCLNWVRMSPSMQHTLNHLVHSTGGAAYSVVGSALYYSEPSDLNCAAASSILRSRLQKLFPALARHQTAVYWGPKTEIVGDSQLRNYQSKILDVDGLTVVLPGKLTLAFSVAAAICRRFGYELRGDIGKFADSAYLETLVQEPRHASAVRHLIMAKAA